MQVLNNYLGCDFVLKFPEEYKNTGIKLLQLTDIQVINAEQRRTPDRLRIDEINAWSPERFDENCGNHIRSLVATASPDLIFITGDIVYGSFDDAGTTFEWFCDFMDSFKIPWAPVFGNHDNESARGVAWQCERFEKSRYCIFKRGNVSGNSNYTVGIAIGNELIRVIYMIDTNGCKTASDPSVIRERGIYPDQIAWISSTSVQIRSIACKSVPAFMAFHIPTAEFVEAEVAKGYRNDNRAQYAIGVDVPQCDKDFGCCYENYQPIVAEGFRDALKRTSTDAVFVGHCHSINTVITYDGVTYVFGLKTGQYDYHNPYQLGGTLITLKNGTFDVKHIPALVKCIGFAGGSEIYNGFFAKFK